ncbi:hypothetical protein AB0K40_08625 [Nonomuraea bangladeshensis]|uniref:PE domain-containing protein n=1 Tax=Nonomuraea bangladeshensis TaxID=404385 RepID=A0ABV3GZ53_9ACTN
MTAPQHRAQLAVRVERLEAAAFRLGIDLGDIKTAVEQLPTTIRQEILEYTEPVFGEIMAGNASLATKEDLDQLKELVDNRFAQMDDRFAQMDDKLDRVLTALSQPPSN